MSTCRRSEIDGLVFGGLTPERTSAARAHLVSCEACRAEHHRLLAERDLFVDRRRARAVRDANDPLPEFDAIMTLAQNPQGLWARCVAFTLSVCEPREGKLGQIAIAGAVGLSLFGVAHDRSSSVLPSRSLTVESPAALSSSLGRSAPSHDEVLSCDEQSECQVSRQGLTELDRQVSLAVPSEPNPVKCVASPMASVLPSPLDRTRSESEAMCIADAI